MRQKDPADEQSARVAGEKSLKEQAATHYDLAKTARDNGGIAFLTWDSS